MRKLKGLLGLSWLLTALVMLAASHAALADGLYRGVRIGDDMDQPLTFRLGTGPVDSGVIWAVGMFEFTDAARSDQVFQAFLDRNKAGIRPGMPVVFQSGGGNPVVGFAIGRLIRAHGLRTIVGQSSKRPNDFPGTIEPGVCASSCAFAFLGGVERSVPPGSLLGVHDVNLTGHDVPEPLVIGEQFGAEFTDYMREMGVDTRLGVDAAQYNSADEGEKGIHWLTPAEMASYHVTTGVATTWQIEQAGSSFPLIGDTDSQLSSNPNRLTFWCERKDAPELLIGVEFVPPERTFANLAQTPASFIANVRIFRLVADPDAAGGGPRPTLDIDPAEIRSPLTANGSARVNAFFKATPRLLDFINAAKILRVGFDGPQLWDGEQSFDTDVAAGRTKIAAFVASCR